MSQTTIEQLTLAIDDVLTTHAAWVSRTERLSLARRLAGVAFEVTQARIVNYENKIEAMIGEFGDNPADCLAIIGHYIEMAQHYRAHPNAPREGEL